MPLQTPEEMENTPIPKLGSITWTKCSERMPPDEIEFIVNVDGILYWAFAVGPCLRRNIKAHIKTAKWTEFTKEKWEFLNR